jgi:hypothetical protein
MKPFSAPNSDMGSKQVSLGWKIVVHSVRSDLASDWRPRPADDIPVLHPMMHHVHEQSEMGAKT